MRIFGFVIIYVLCFWGLNSVQTHAAFAFSQSARAEFPKNTFEDSVVDPAEILSGGPPRDGIPAIDAPEFVPVLEATDIPDL